MCGPDADIIFLLSELFFLLQVIYLQ